MKLMRRLGVIGLCLTVGLFSWLSAAWAESERFDDGSYRLSRGDVLSVAVYGEPDLSRDLTVNDNGSVSFPLVGEVPLSGLTTGEARDVLTERLKQGYLLDPQVSVTVVRYRPVFVNGQVRTPGGVEFQPGLTVRKAITLAGGMTERASKRRVYLLPDQSKAGTEPKRVGLDEAVRPGDIITVEESFF